MAETFDVIVVGAGPGGSATAGLLAKQGARVALLDKARFPRPKACGEYTSPELPAVLARIGALQWVEEARPNHVGQMRVFAPHGDFTMDYHASGPASANVLATPRERLDHALVQYAVAAGADFRERMRVSEVVRAGKKVVGVQVAGRDGGTTEFRAPLVIGADGSHSVVARELGLVRSALWPRKLGLVARYEGISDIASVGEMHVAAHGYCGLAPLADGLVNVGLVIAMPRPDGDHLSALARYEQALEKFPLLRERIARAQRVTPVRGMGPVGVRASRTSGKGFMLVGDAAGFFDPFTGEGVYKALRGAEMAAQMAGQAIAANDFSARLLDGYSRARRREFIAKDLVCRVVQVFVQNPAGMSYVASRLNRRPRQSHILTSVLGDFMDARAALSPLYLWNLLRP